MPDGFHMNFSKVMMSLNCIYIQNLCMKRLLKNVICICILGSLFCGFNFDVWHVPAEQIFPDGDMSETMRGVLQCVAVCCSVLQCAAVCCSVF